MSHGRPTTATYDSTARRAPELSASNSLGKCLLQERTRIACSPGWHDPPDECCGRWTADGSISSSNRKVQIWALAQKASFLHSEPEAHSSDFQPVCHCRLRFPARMAKSCFVIGQNVPWRTDALRREVRPVLTVSRRYFSGNMLPSRKMRSGLPTCPIAKAPYGEARWTGASASN